MGRGQSGCPGRPPGIDAAGKDGTINKVMEAFNPQGCPVTSFKVPSTEELAHDYLWRVHQHVPKKGEVGIFNRSHYEAVLVERVHGIVPKRVWSARYAQINHFERMLAESETTIVKFFLQIDRDEQRERLQARYDDPAKRWKFSMGDLEERKLWDDYQRAFDEALTKTSTAWAPWYVIPANHKWFRDLAVSSILADTLADLKPAYPPEPDLPDLPSNKERGASSDRYPSWRGSIARAAERIIGRDCRGGDPDAVRVQGLPAQDERAGPRHRRHHRRALGTVVNSLVNDIIMPPIGMALGGVDFSQLKIVLKAAAGGDPATEVAIRYGKVPQRDHRVRGDRLRRLADLQDAHQGTPAGRGQDLPVLQGSERARRHQVPGLRQRDLSSTEIGLRASSGIAGFRVASEHPDHRRH